MTAARVIGIVLVVLGVVALVYGGFTYTSETHDAKLGPLELSVKEKERVNIPVWAGLGAVIVGAAVLAAGLRRS
jgi:drug/metabolite transporter (DMT)-like permease